jgi:hypothetical protein
MRTGPAIAVFMQWTTNPPSPRASAIGRAFIVAFLIDRIVLAIMSFLLLSGARILCSVRVWVLEHRLAVPAAARHVAAIGTNPDHLASAPYPDWNGPPEEG